MSKGKWLEVSTVSRRLNVSEATVYRLIKNKSLRCTRFGVASCLRISEKSVIDFEVHRTRLMDEA